MTRDPRTDPRAVPAVREMVKVHLPGESPWAECVLVHGDGTWEGRIDNRLVTDWTDDENRAFMAAHFPSNRPGDRLEKLHSHHQNDVVRFAWVRAFDDVWLWVPERRLIERRLKDRRASATVLARGDGNG